MNLIDTHAHLDCFIKRGALKEVLEASRANSVAKILNASANYEDWKVYSECSLQNENIFWAIGLHPTELDADSLSKLDEVEAFMKSAKPPCAMGEIGLDYYRISADDANYEEIVEAQKTAFKTQLALAKKFKLKAIIHARSAFDDAMKIIEDSGLGFENTVFHCFSGSVDEVRRLNELGGRASFTGIITYKQAGEMRLAMLAQGLEKLMLETDCPYLAPVPFRGKECSPMHLALTARQAAESFNIGLEKMAEITTQNAESFFGI